MLGALVLIERGLASVVDQDEVDGTLRVWRLSYRAPALPQWCGRLRLAERNVNRRPEVLWADAVVLASCQKHPPPRLITTARLFAM